MAPARHSSRVSLFMDFAPGRTGRDVPDPYYGGPADFDQVLDLVEAASEGLLERLLGYSTK
jgi:protein-tyrosine phosphatase